MDKISSEQLRKVEKIKPFGHSRASKKIKKGHETGVFPVLQKLTHMYPKFRNISRPKGHPVQTWRFTVKPCIQILILNCTHSWKYHSPASTSSVVWCLRQNWHINVMINGHFKIRAHPKKAKERKSRSHQSYKFSTWCSRHYWAPYQ